MSTAREMTLDEWMDALPKIHRAQKELASLRAALSPLPCGHPAGCSVGGKCGWCAEVGAMKKALGYALTVRRQNTPEWLDGLAEYVTAADPDRTWTFDHRRDAMRVEPKASAALAARGEGK